VIHQRESGQSSGLYFSRCNEGTGSGTEDKKILDSSESRLAVTRRFCQFFSCRQGSQTNNEGQYHLPIRSSWQVGSKTCFVRFQTGNTSFFSDRVAVSGSGHSASAYAISAVAATSSSETSTKIMTETLVPSRAELGHTTTHFDASSARHYLQGVCVTAPPIRGEPRRIPGHTAPLSESRA
jgi:hypothetical protein